MAAFRSIFPTLRAGAVALLLALGWVSPGNASGTPPASAHRVGPPPAWVEWLPLPAATDAPGGDRVALLVDDQISLNGPEPERFYRRVSRVTGSTGIEDAGDFSVEYDPSFERVVLHGVWVERGGERTDRLASARVDTLQREQGLESGLIDGRLTVHVVLDDIRVGDTVDFSVSVNGINPALGNRYWNRYWLDFGVPTVLRRVRLLAPEGRRLETRIGGEGLQHELIRRAGVVDQRWSLQDGKPRPSEDRVPDWYFDGPSIEIADTASWADIVQWALPLYALQDPASIEAIAAEIGLERGQTDEDGILRAIRFVQDEVRYTGLELGAGAYRPRPPVEVARSRFGDCKDKVMLLVALLRYGGVEAAPALVDVDEREHLADRLPSPRVFDHVIVRLLHAGQTYWIDATNDHQRGRLRTLAQAEYGRALVVAAGERELREIALAEQAEPRIDIEEVIDLREKDGSLAERGEYRIHAVYRGADADDMRRSFAVDSADAMGERFLRAVAEYYPDIEQVRPPSFRDDPEANEFATDEHYSMPAIWTPLEEGKGKEANFSLSEIDRALLAPKAVARRAPWDLGERSHVRQKLEVQLDGDWPVEDEQHRVANDHLSFDGRVWSDGRTLKLEGQLRKLADTVPAREVAKLRRDVDALSEHLNYGITLNEDAAGELQWQGLFDARLVALLLGVAALGAWVVWSARSSSTAPVLGILFRPRATVRAAIDARRTPLAFGLLFIAGLGSVLFEEEALRALDEGRLGMLMLLGGAAGVGAVFTGSISAGIYAVAGSLLGGKGRLTDVFIAGAHAQLPFIGLVPVLALAFGLYGGQVLLDPQQIHWLPLLLLILTVVPMLVWSILLWFATLAEAHRTSIARAVWIGLSPAAVVLLVIALVVAARAALG
jgi:transglutaminase-like putative cysteine protease